MLSRTDTFVPFFSAFFYSSVKTGLMNPSSASYARCRLFIVITKTWTTYFLLKKRTYTLKTNKKPDDSRLALY
ncbi:hypothetical protein BpHYR1_051132 [Brachionus plicatilis]|uniref:Uncharacterized protein n=1 Tax=Brachionus plicatilis TaxID=10195 RepID=A0A3M7S115_BRAPC|nr:hypothetical protein BpHYR1_051132 [Brachionus plicatilis]